MRTQLPPLETRGRNLLLVALFVLAASLASSMFDQDLGNWHALGSELVGYGPLFLVLYFAFWGGGFSLAAIRFVLLCFGGILLLWSLAVLLTPASEKPADLNLSSMYSLDALTMFAGYGFLCWVFFLSSSTRAYIRHRRTAGKISLEPTPLRQEDS